MKKIMVAGLAMLIAVPAVAQAQDRRDRREFRDAQREFRQERREFRQERRDFRNDDDRTRAERREFRQDRREFRDERREFRDARREYRDDRRDDRRHYGYRYPAPQNYYYYAPPRTTYYYSQPSYGYGYGYGAPSYYGHRWSRGQILPPHYRRHVVYDYHRYGWGPPPRGYAYYRTDTGDIILAAIATGLILSIIGGGW